MKNIYNAAVQMAKSNDGDLVEQVDNVLRKQNYGDLVDVLLEAFRQCLTLAPDHPETLYLSQ